MILKQCWRNQYSCYKISIEINLFLFLVLIYQTCRVILCYRNWLAYEQTFIVCNDIDGRKVYCLQLSCLIECNIGNIRMVSFALWTRLITMKFSTYQAIWWLLFYFLKNRLLQSGSGCCKLNTAAYYRLLLDTSTYCWLLFPTDAKYCWLLFLVLTAADCQWLLFPAVHCC